MIITSVLTFVALSVKGQPNKVHHAGALMQIMHEGKLGANASLDSLAQENVYGLGALDSLSGEFMIDDGRIFVSQVSNEKESVFENKSSRATLLVYSQVNEWEAFDFKDKDLDAGLKKVAKEKNLTGPFPFMLKGSFPGLDYHIINFDPSKDQISDHKKSALKSSLADKDVRVLGFYSTSHQGIFTHHNSNVHMHVICHKEKRMGHVDKLDLADASFTLLVPKS